MRLKHEAHAEHEAKKSFAENKLKALFGSDNPIDLSRAVLSKKLI
jgi:hypothetical protein